MVEVTATFTIPSQRKYGCRELQMTICKRIMEIVIGDNWRMWDLRTIRHGNFMERLLYVIPSTVFTGLTFELTICSITSCCEGPPHGESISYVLSFACRLRVTTTRSGSLIASCQRYRLGRWNYDWVREVSLRY